MWSSWAFCCSDFLRILAVGQRWLQRAGWPAKKHSAWNFVWAVVRYQRARLDTRDSQATFQQTRGWRSASEGSYFLHLCTTKPFKCQTSNMIGRLLSESLHALWVADPAVDYTSAPIANCLTDRRTQQSLY